jgi:hypothetical protein
LYARTCSAVTIAQRTVKCAGWRSEGVVDVRQDAERVTGVAQAFERRVGVRERDPAGTLSARNDARAGSSGQPRRVATPRAESARTSRYDQ